MLTFRVVVLMFNEEANAERCVWRIAETLAGFPRPAD